MGSNACADKGLGWNKCVSYVICGQVDLRVALVHVVMDANGNNAVPEARLSAAMVCDRVTPQLGEHFDEEKAMYYHPFMFDWTNGERTLAACKAFVGVWLDGVARQQQAHADAMSTFYARQLESLRMLSETRDMAALAGRLMSYGAPERLGFAELSARLGGIAVDTHRKLGELVESHVGDLSRSLVGPVPALETPQRKAGNGGRAVGRRQIAA